MAQVQNEGDFRLGFWFGMLLAQTMGLDTTNDAIYDQLRGLARGELSLMASPEEAFGKVEKKIGRPLTDLEKAFLRSGGPQDRVQQDALNAELAAMVLRIMGQPL
jgi:hypothetical protein